LTFKNGLYTGGSVTGFAATTHDLVSSHTASALTAGQVLKATGATTFGFAALQQADVAGLTTTDSPTFAAVIAAYKSSDGTAGSSSTVSGLVFKNGLYTSGAISGFAATSHSLLTSHTVSGLTTGQFLKATGATTFGFAAIGQSDVTGLKTSDSPTFTAVTAAHKAADGTAGASSTVSGLVFKDGLFTSGTISGFATTSHNLLTSHTVSGLTTGQFLKATSATAFGFATISQADVSGLTTTDSPVFTAVTAAFRSTDNTAGASSTVGGLVFKNGLFTSGSITNDHARGHAMASASDHTDWPTGLTVAELGYLKGVTSTIQDQLNGKASLSGAVFTGTVKATGYTSADGTAGATATTGGATFKNGLYVSGTIAASGGSADAYDLAQSMAFDGGWL
jgi:predicted alpha/beta-hydrolase family hydrolase